MARKANHIKVKDFEKKITIIAVMIVAGLIGAYTLGFSFAAQKYEKIEGTNYYERAY